ncbi:MAG TPA: ubiquitin-like small modifier protein 1 [Candidatus Limnocylindria bacterium]
MSRVRIPPVLRDVVGGSRELVAHGATVAAVLDGLFADQPALRDRLTEDGRLSSFVNVYVNDTDIRHRQGLETKVSSEDVVILLPAMAGGCDEVRAHLSSR